MAFLKTIHILLFFSALTVKSELISKRDRRAMQKVYNSLMKIYNEHAVLISRGTIIKLEDASLSFGPSSAPLKLNCTNGYIRPFPMHMYRMANLKNRVYSEVIINELSSYYKNCLVTEKSPHFNTGDVNSAVYVLVSYKIVMGYLELLQEDLTGGGCTYKFRFHMTGKRVGIEARIVAFSASTLYTVFVNDSTELMKPLETVVETLSVKLLPQKVSCYEFL